uniref:Uncharacterized protein n=2 Tax=Canis lupus familiaris TaxID=9615 RepID=A0A8C0PUI2_CANLF
SHVPQIRFPSCLGTSARKRYRSCALSGPVYPEKGPHGGAMPQPGQGHDATLGEAARGNASEKRSSEHPRNFQTGC